MNKKLFSIIVGVLVFVSLFAFLINDNSIEKEKQRVVIGMKDWVYSPMIVEVEAGVPVEISLDDSVRGCFRDLVFPELGIRKYMKTSKDTIQVTFEKGEYTFACSMFMGQGKIVAR